VLAASALLLLSSLTSLPVQGASTCPLPADVEQHLSGLVARHEARHLMAEVESDGGRVRVRLRGAKGGLLGERVLDGGSACEELAQAAAVVIASWVGELRAAESELLPSEERRAEPTPPLRTLPARYTFEVGAGMLASVSRGNVGFGAELAAAATSVQGRWGFHVVLAFLGERDLPTQRGELTYERYFLAVGPHRRIALEGFRLDVGGEALLGILSLSGDALAVGQSTLGVDPGISASVRLVSDVGPWLGVRTLAWPERVRVATGEGVLRPVPWLELELALGLSWGGR
jgi:hypothetical protein